MLKRTLVLIPGMPLDGALWSHQRRFLTNDVDIYIADSAVADSIEGLASKILQDVRGSFAVAGLSMGGYVAMELVRRAPERISRLALLNTNARADTPEQTANRLAAIELARQGRMKAVVAASIGRLVHADRLKDRELVENIYAQAERVGVDGYIRQQTAIMSRVDSRDSLRAVQVPTLVICGREDALSGPELHAEMADAVPGGRLAIIEECGHLSPMERPQAVTALLRDWLLYR